MGPEEFIEGVLMLFVSSIGILLNIFRYGIIALHCILYYCILFHVWTVWCSSIFYFAHYKHQRTFHRWNISQKMHNLSNQIVQRLMLLLAVVDTMFLCFSILTFSLPQLSEKYAEYHWMLLVPYTLPLAQVMTLTLINRGLTKMLSLLQNDRWIAVSNHRSLVLTAFCDPILW